MEYKGIQIPDKIEKISRNTLGMFSGDKDSWDISPESIEAMMTEAKRVANGMPCQINIQKTDRSWGGSILSFDAVVVVEEESDEDKFERIAEQMADIDKNHN